MILKDRSFSCAKHSQNISQENTADIMVLPVNCEYDNPLSLFKHGNEMSRET